MGAVCVYEGGYVVLQSGAWSSNDAGGQNERVGEEVVMYISLEKASSTPQHRQQPTAHVTNTDTRYNASQSIVTHTRLCTQQLKHKEVLTPPGIDRHIHTSFPGNSTTHLVSIHTHHHDMSHPHSLSQ